jgi:cbb3-type cytochrome oxidase subunit 1
VHFWGQDAVAIFIRAEELEACLMFIPLWAWRPGKSYELNVTCVRRMMTPLE